jgi:hypothetical protein
MSQPSVNPQTHKQSSTNDLAADRTDHSAEIVGVALLVIGLVSFVGVVN